MPSANLPDPTQLDVRTWTRDLVPPLVRRPRLLALLNAFLQPLAELNAVVVAYAIGARRTLAYNCQTLAFEGLLNDAFDPTLRRIRIANTDVDFQPDFYNLAREAQPPNFLFRRSEGAAPVFLRSYAEYFGAVGFIVLVPTARVPADPAAATIWKVRLEATIRRYKYATITHTTRYVAAPDSIFISNPNFPPVE